LKILSLLDWKKLPESKRLDSITKMYFHFCTNVNIYQNGKISKDYHRVKQFFKKQSETDINTVYNYLLTMPLEAPNLTIAELFRVSECHRLDEIKKPVLPNNQNETKHVSIDEVLDW